VSSDPEADTDETSEPTLAAVQAELEAIIQRLEDEETGLEESIALYEKGSGLLARANRVLADAEQRVRILTQAMDETGTDDELSDDDA